MVYFIIISVIAIVITTYDKLAAKWFSKARVRESVLLLIAAAGGSIAMLITMLIIRHKTRKPKFMTGIPVIIILQVLGYIALKKLGF